MSMKAGQVQLGFTEPGEQIDHTTHLILALTAFQVSKTRALAGAIQTFSIPKVKTVIIFARRE
jgi:hypothetical protein